MFFTLYYNNEEFDFFLTENDVVVVEGDPNTR